MKTVWNKGKKMPHNKEWEKNRLKAVRANAYKNRGRKSPKSKETIKIAQAAIKKKRGENPEKYNQIAINNLPKNTKKQDNPNWRGGVTPFMRAFRTSPKYQQWRKAVLEWDNYQCRICGSTVDLHVHHIIPVKETLLTALMRMNGATLCFNCHKKTDSYGGKSHSVEKLDGFGKTTFIIRTIPQELQAYRTVGDWAIGEDGLIVIFVSAMDNIDYEFLVAIHEQVESYLCYKRGISEEDVNKYDLEHLEDDDPGSNEDAPYHKEHMFAMEIEAMMANELKVVWPEYEDAQEKEVKKYK